MKRSIILPCLVTAFVALSPAGVAFAHPPTDPGNPSPSGTGQPSQDAESQPLEPAGFMSGGFANAKTRYANPDSTGGTHSGNSHVVSQYDVAAFHVSQTHQ
jgi:hypothetical protein